MRDFLAKKWFELGVLLSVVIVALSVSYYFLFLLPFKANHRYSYRKIQDSEILAVIPAGYHLAQVSKGKEDVNYITAHLESSKDKTDNAVIVLLEWNKPQTFHLFDSQDHPVMVKVLTFNYESGKWEETNKWVSNQTNIRFSYTLIKLDGDDTDKIVVFPFFYTPDAFTFDAAGHPMAIKSEPRMVQRGVVLGLRNGELEDMIRQDIPVLDNVTVNGGSGSVMVGYDGSVTFGQFVKPPTADWKGCYPIQYERYFYRKNIDELLHTGAFLKFDEYITKIGRASCRERV